MNKVYMSKVLLRLLCGKRSKTAKLGDEMIKYLSRKGSIRAVTKEMEKRCGHPCGIELDAVKKKVCIRNTDKLITKRTLSERWSPMLIERFFYEPTMTVKNPYFSNASPMCLYAMSEVKRIERSISFQKEYRRVNCARVKSYRRKVAKKVANLIGISVYHKH